MQTQLNPTGWSVVLIGRWNPAILSPAGIKNHVFKLTVDQKVRVAIPLDGITSYFVTNPEGTLVAHVEDERFQIEIPKCNYTSLSQGMLAGKNALEALPVTPISAVGINVNFIIESSCEPLIVATNGPTDGNFSNEKYEITGRSMGRSMRFGTGQINVTVVQQNSQFQVNCNFHLATQSVEEAKKWLETPVAAISKEIEKIEKIFGVQLKEKRND